MLESALKNKELLSKLTVKSVIVYGFASNSLGKTTKLACDKIIELRKGFVRVDVSLDNFFYRDIPYNRILAIKDDNYGKERIKGLEGKYHVLHPKKLSHLSEFYTEN